VRLVLAGVTNSLNEILTVSNLGIQSAPPELQAYALPAILDNQGTDSPLDDTYSTDLVITPANLPFSSIPQQTPSTLDLSPKLRPQAPLTSPTPQALT